MCFCAVVVSRFRPRESEDSNLADGAQPVASMMLDGGEATEQLHLETSSVATSVAATARPAVVGLLSAHDALQQDSATPLWDKLRCVTRAWAHNPRVSD